MVTKSQQVYGEYEEGTIINTPKWETSGITSGTQVLSGTGNPLFISGGFSTAIEYGNKDILIIENEEVDISKALLEDKEFQNSIERARREMKDGGIYFLASNSRVSWTIDPPSSRISIWRRASCSIAWPMKRIEFTFLTSQRVPSGAPGFRTETLMSARSDPSSILPSQVPR